MEAMQNLRIKTVATTGTGIDQLGQKITSHMKGLKSTNRLEIRRKNNSRIEILELAKDKFIDKKGEGIQHIAFRVQDIDKVLHELKQQGVKLIDEKPRHGAGGARIAFVHPKNTKGMLLELCQRD